MAGAIMSMVSQHWGTPEYLLDGTRYTLGGEIDLDPCGNAAALERVRANKAVWLPDEAHRACGYVDGNPYSSLELPEGVIVGDGLAVEWTRFKNWFCNPPYGRSKGTGTSIYDWVKKGAIAGKTSPGLMLIPAAVGTKHWQDIIFPTADKICFLRGRVKFLLEGKDNVSTTPSAMVLWLGEYDDGILTRFYETFEPLGRIV